ncbi:hypothetical protein A3B64_01965 [candidate division WWE3 bacterium RIFCSPLOWO2_01_FULL_37_24]|uniref:Uncharacterized protein n=1 Tax=candidate division WWE3 bacterium RIFCSPHIGHO2_02_FULL_38_14 TaxID=1802620 RepID=A0A1F4V959_UNCKA|nr:MAG: hypothetical protein A3D91_03860 [candidate division WWE3 bacterium RIFCSPHIGHO2_02_FULL_38_14]OGC54253.1 MAG: hypothetical protein A3B64_01965 [candidate division WWE3 bacterium RIFCSPLOWO2_01_FULL_37_24]
MDINNVLPQLFTLGGFVKLIEVLIVIIQIIYTVFAFLITRQVKLMNHSFHTDTSVVFGTIAWIHFLFAAGFTILSFLIL